MTHTEKILAKVIGQILRGESPDRNFLSECSSEDFFACAEKNGVLHQVFNPVSAVIGECTAVKKYCFLDSKYVLNEAKQSYAWDEFKLYAEKNGIDILMLKGIYIKKLYPEPSLREMCDIDFLFRPGQEKVLSDVLTSLGYQKKKTTACHDGWFNPENGVTFEAHRVLSSEADNKISYYGGLFSRALRYENNNHIFHMTNEDVYIHLLLHLRSHLKTKSANLKQLADIYIIYNSNGFDKKSVNQHLNSLKLGRLSENIIRLINYLFEGNSENNSDEIQELADYITGNLYLGEFGYDEAKEAYLSSGRKLKSLLRQVFPKPEKIYNSFPTVKKYKILLPFGYVYRLFQVFGIRKKNFKKKLNLAANVSYDAAEQGKRTAEFFEKYGI